MSRADGLAEITLSRRGVSLEAGLDIEDAAWRTAALSADRREGIAAFVEKRKPDWPGQ